MLTTHTFKLLKNSTCPIINIPNLMGINALIDTGASIPVWTADASILTRIMRAKLCLKDTYITGFGGRCYGDVYKIDFNLGGISFPDMPIFTARIGGNNKQMILSASMFTGLQYIIDDANKEFKIVNLDSKDRISCTVPMRN